MNAADASSRMGRDHLICLSIYLGLERPMNVLEILDMLRDTYPTLHKSEVNRFLYDMARFGVIQKTKPAGGKPLFYRPTGASSFPTMSFENCTEEPEIDPDRKSVLRVYCDLGTKGKYKKALLGLARQYPDVLFRFYATSSVAINLSLSETTPNLRLTYSQEKNAISVAMSLDIGADLDYENENNCVLLFGDTVALSTLEKELLPFCSYVQRHRDFTAFQNDVVRFA